MSFERPSLAPYAAPRPAAALETVIPLFSPAFLRVLAAQMTIGLGFSSYFMLPKYLTQELHADAANVGIVSSAGLIASVLASPFVGRALDRFGRRLPLVLGGVLILVTSLGMSTVRELGPWLYALRLGQGIGYALAYNATAAVVADIAPANRLGQAMGLLGVASLVTSAMAPPLTEYSAAIWGWQCVFLSIAITGAAICLFALQLPNGQVRTSGVAVPAMPGAWRIWLATGITGAAFGSLMTFTQPFALALGADHLSGYLFGYTLGALFVRLAFGRVADRNGRDKVARYALLGYGGVAILTAWLSPALLIVFGLGFGLAHGMIYPALAALAAESSAPERRGRALSAFNGAFNGGAGFAILGCGWVAKALGYSSVFVGVGALAMIVAASVRLRAAPLGSVVSSSG